MRYSRDMIGHGPTPPDAAWPDDAKIAVQFVVNYEEGAENNNSAITSDGTTLSIPPSADLQVQSIRLMTNNPVKVNALSKLGLTIRERIPLETGHNDHNARYLATKAGKLGHLLGAKDA